MARPSSLGHLTFLRLGFRQIPQAEGLTAAGINRDNKFEYFFALTPAIYLS